MNNIHTCYYKSPVGELIIGIYKNKLCLLDWRYRKQRIAIDHRISKGLNASYIHESHALQHQVIEQLDHYFLRNLKIIDVPIVFTGTAFQQQVWTALLQIPYGQTVSYLSLSRKLNNEKAIRAVANANGANALSIIVRCHRVIGSNGELTGYAGGIPAKKKLLQIEGALSPGQLDLF